MLNNTKLTASALNVGGDAKVDQFVDKNIDNGVLLDVLDKSMEDTNNILYVSKPIENDINEVNVIDKPVNTVSSSHYIRAVNKNYYELEDKWYINPYKAFLEYTNGHRNIYLQNDYKGSIRSFYEQAYENEPNKQIVADYVFTPLEYTYPYNDIHYFETSNMAYAKALDYVGADEQQYIVSECPKYNYEYKQECSTDKYDVYRIPRDLLKMFTHITKYWQEIKNKLTLDKNTGYYCYVIKQQDKTISIPIICKHQAMILDNVPISKISTQCYTNGVCKYCGQEIIAYNDSNNFVLPTAAMSLIISFSEIFTHKYSVDTIIFDTTDYIIGRLQQMDISCYSTDECVGWTCLILIKLCQLGAKQFETSDAKLKKLINKLSKNLSILGKTDKDIEELLQNMSLFEGIDTLINMLQSDGVITKEDNEELTKKVNNIDKIIFEGNNKTPKTELQRHYLANDGKLYEIFLAYKLLLNKAYNSPFKYVVNSIVNDIDEETISNTINMFGHEFFRKAAKIYCPVNCCHEWVKGKCKHCGLNEKLDNIDDIYNKYSTIINNTNAEPPKLMKEDIKETNQNYEHLISEIKKTDCKDFNEIVKQYVSYNDMLTLDKLTNKPSKDYVELVAIDLNMPYDVLYNNLKDDDDMKRLCCYMISKQGEENTINNIIVCLLTLINPLEFIVKD